MQSSLASLTGGSPTFRLTQRACPSLPPALPCPMLKLPHPDRHHRLSDPPRDQKPLTVSTCSLLPPCLGQMDSQIPGAGHLSQRAPATAPVLQAGTLLRPLGPCQTLAPSQGSTDSNVTCSCNPAVPSGGSLKKNKTSACLSACPRVSRSHRHCHIQRPSHRMAGRHQWQRSQL